MAYKVTLTRHCSAVACGRVATWTVYNVVNAPSGVFCDRHADAAVEAQGEGEAASRA